MELYLQKLPWATWGSQTPGFVREPFDGKEIIVAMLIISYLDPSRVSDHTPKGGEP